MAALPLSFLSQAIPTAITLGTTIFLAAVLAPDDFGAFSILTLSLVFVATLSTLNSQPAVIRWARNASTGDGVSLSNLREARHTIGVWTAISIGLGAIISLGTQVWISPYIQIPVVVLLTTMFLLPSGQSAFYGALVAAEAHFGVLSVVNAAATGSVLVLAVLLIGPLGILGAAIALVVGNWVRLFAAFLAARGTEALRSVGEFAPDSSIPDELSAGEVRNNLWPLAATAFVFQGTAFACGMIVAEVGGIEAAGFYRIALGVFNLSLLLPSSFNAVLLPHLVDLERDGVRRTQSVLKLVRYSNVALFPMAIVGLSVAGPFLGFFLTPDYAPAVALSATMIPLLLITSPLTIFVSDLQSTGRMRAVLAVDSVRAAIHIGLLPLVLITLGIEWLSIVFLVSYGVALLTLQILRGNWASELAAVLEPIVLVTAILGLAGAIGNRPLATWIGAWPLIALAIWAVVSVQVRREVLSALLVLFRDTIRVKEPPIA